MNNRIDNERLLSDVLAEASPPDLREALLNETLRLARRRKRARQTRHAIAAVVILSLLAVLVWHNSPQRSVVRQQLAKTPPPTYKLVRTEPLAASAVVVTQPFSSKQLAAPPAGTEIVHTTLTGSGFRILNDDELLALVSPRPVALVRTGPHSEELVFVNPEDENGFPAN
jgi:cytoskeletal protein RodZ